MPCSIWLPPCASGPVFTVSRPILNGAPCAIAGRANSVVASPVAASAVPAKNVRRLSFEAMQSSLVALEGLPPGDWRCAGVLAQLWSGPLLLSSAPRYGPSRSMWSHGVAAEGARGEPERALVYHRIIGFGQGVWQGPRRPARMHFHRILNRVTP